MLEERGGYLIVIARFIPGGRTAATFAAGSLDWPWRRFIVFDVAAGAIWGSYAGLLGYFGGKTFKDSPFKGFLVAFGDRADDHVRRRGDPLVPQASGCATLTTPPGTRSLELRT